LNKILMFVHITVSICSRKNISHAKLQSERTSQTVQKL